MKPAACWGCRWACACALQPTLTVNCAVSNSANGNASSSTQRRRQHAATSADQAAARINMQLGLGYLQQGNLPIAKEKLERARSEDPHNAGDPRRDGAAR